MLKNIKENLGNLTTEVRTSIISGKGTFAKSKISSGTFITTLRGKPLIAEDANAELCSQLGISRDDPLQIGDTLFLILDYESKTINHSCNPNTGIKNQSDLYAIKDINVDDEVTYDYSTTSSVNDNWIMNCDCKAVICRKKIGNILTIPLKTLMIYDQLNIFPDYVKQQLRKINQIPRYSIRNIKQKTLAE